jgi:hypothetical protein
MEISVRLLQKLGGDELCHEEGGNARENGAISRVAGPGRIPVKGPR